MVVASKNSRDGIFHCPDCLYVNRIFRSNRIYFQSRSEALKQGYNFCICCSPLMKSYRREQEECDRYLQRNQMKMTLNYGDETLYIKSINGYWKILYDEKISQCVLYHRNEMDHSNAFSILPGYHDQNVHSRSLLQLGEYIHRHDLYREEHPWIEKPEPKPGTPYYHRRKKEYDKWKKDVERRQYTLGIDQIIDSFSKGKP